MSRNLKCQGSLFVCTVFLLMLLPDQVAAVHVVDHPPVRHSAVAAPGSQGRSDSAAFHGSIVTYQKDIKQLEDQFGVYDHRLVDQYLGLGISLKNQGEHDEAILSLKRAMHLSRINDGLHNLKQVSMLSSLVESYVAEKQWGQANKKQTDLYHLQQLNYDRDDIRLLQSVSKMAQWHLRVYKRGVGEDPLEHLLKARALNGQAIGIIESNYEPNTVHLSDLLYRQAQVDYYLIRFLTENPQSEAVYRAGFRSSLGLSVQTQQELRQVVMSDPYLDGEKALMRRVAGAKSNPEYTVEGQVRALRELGDWYLLFDKRHSAITTYEEAQQLSLAVPRVDQLKFDQPRPVSFALEAPTPVLAESVSGLKRGYVQAKFDVTAAGWARGVEIIASNPPQMMDSVVRRSIRATRYRPRIVEGEAVLTKDVIYIYEFNF